LISLVRSLIVPSHWTLGCIPFIPTTALNRSAWIARRYAGYPLATEDRRRIVRALLGHGIARFRFQWSLLRVRLAEYAVNRTISGVNQIFLIYFIKGSDGIWRLESM